MYAGLLPPCQFGWHLLDDFDGVGYRHGVCLRLVDGVVNDAIAPAGMPFFYQHRVAIHQYECRVVNVDAVALILGDAQRVDGMMLYRHILRGCAAGAQRNQGTGYKSQDDARQYAGDAHAFFVLVVGIVSHKPMD